MCTSSHPLTWDRSSIWLSSTLFFVLSVKLGREYLPLPRKRLCGPGFLQETWVCFLCPDPFIRVETMLTSSKNKNGSEGAKGQGYASNPKPRRGQASTLPWGYAPTPKAFFSHHICWQFLVLWMTWNIDSGLIGAFCSFTSGYWASAVQYAFFWVQGWLWWTAVPDLLSQNLLLWEMEPYVQWFWEGFQVIVLSCCFCIDFCIC